MSHSIVYDIIHRQAHVCPPWDSAFSDCPFVTTPVWLAEGEKDESNHYHEYNICRYPGCAAWIKDGAKTCREHQAWYSQNIRDPVKRLVQLVRLADERDLGSFPAIVLGDVGGLEIGVIAPDLERLCSDPLLAD